MSGGKELQIENFILQIEDAVGARGAEQGAC
jgi:hypothetical protein